jgi:hypothetical protein
VTTSAPAVEAKMLPDASGSTIVNAALGCIEELRRLPAPIVAATLRDNYQLDRETYALTQAVIHGRPAEPGVSDWFSALIGRLRSDLDSNVVAGVVQPYADWLEGLCMRVQEAVNAALTPRTPPSIDGTAMERQRVQARDDSRMAEGRALYAELADCFALLLRASPASVGRALYVTPPWSTSGASRRAAQTMLDPALGASWRNSFVSSLQAAANSIGGISAAGETGVFRDDVRRLCGAVIANEMGGA